MNTPRSRYVGLALTKRNVWSLLDNLEWSPGFSNRFGIVHVHCATQKDSARFYSEVIATKGRVLNADGA